jgi:hypothetical protein
MLHPYPRAGATRASLCVAGRTIGAELSGRRSCDARERKDVTHRSGISSVVSPLMDQGTLGTICWYGLHQWHVLCSAVGDRLV